MKNINRWGLAAGLVAALALQGTAQAQGASGGPSPSDRTSSGQSDSGRSGSTASGGTGSTAGSTAAGKVDKKLQERLEKIHAANQAELQMAQLGAQNAASPDVKQLAQQMQGAHQQMDQQLTQTAQTMGVTLEGKEFQKEQQDATKALQKLQSKTGKDFDKDFMSRIVKDHEKDAKEVKDAAIDAQKGNHPELVSMLQQTQTQLQSHLDHARQVQKSLDQGAQRQGRRPSGPSGMSDTGTTPGSTGSGSQSGSGSRGDTGGPPPSGASQGPGGTPGPSGGASGTSSEGPEKSK